MNQGTMAIHTFFFIARTGIEYRSMRQHCAAFVRYVEQIPMAFHTLIVFKRGIGGIAVFGSIIVTLNKMDKDIFDTMKGLLVEKIESVVRCGKVAIHAVSDKTLGIVDMG